MAKVRVPVHRTSPAQTVLVDPAATDGAQIGSNLLLPDGTVGTVEQLRKLFGGTTIINGKQIDTTDDLPEGRYNWYGNVDVIDVADTTYTASRANNDTILRGTATAGLSITVPAGAFAPDTTLYAMQSAAGAVLFVAGAGVTFLQADSAQTRDQGSVIALKQTSPDVWEPLGDLAYFFPATSVHANATAASAQPTAFAATADKQVFKRVGTILRWVQQIAADVLFTPSGNLAATDVQSALVELDTEKVSYTALAASGNTPGASLVGVKPAGNISSTTLAAALNELDTEKLAKNLISAAGDLIVGDATGAPARLARGTTGQVPTVQGDGSLAYATPAAKSSGAGEMLVANGLSAPPVLLTNESQDDYVCAG